MYFRKVFRRVLNEEYEWKDIKKELKKYNIPYNENITTGITTIELNEKNASLPLKGRLFYFNDHIIKNLGYCRSIRKVQNTYRCISSADFWVDYQIKNNKTIIKIYEYI